MTNQLFGEGFDGLHGLRRRERTRLWYRAIPAAESETLPDNAASSAGVVEGPASAEEDGFSQQEIDAFFDEWAADLKAMRAQTPAELTPEARQQRILRRLGECAVVPEADVEIVAAPRTRQRVGISGWRNVPINAPTLMLAASNLLDAKHHGPVLSPGCRYRVLSAEDGIVELEVVATDGRTVSGFCNAVDMSCIDPLIVHLAGGRKGSNRLRFRRLGRGLSHVTGTLIGSSS